MASSTPATGSVGRDRGLVFEDAVSVLQKLHTDLIRLKAEVKKTGSLSKDDAVYARLFTLIIEECDSTLTQLETIQKQHGEDPGACRNDKGAATTHRTTEATEFEKLDLVQAKTMDQILNIDRFFNAIQHQLRPDIQEIRIQEEENIQAKNHNGRFAKPPELKKHFRLGDFKYHTPMQGGIGQVLNLEDRTDVPDDTVSGESTPGQIKESELRQRRQTEFDERRAIATLKIRNMLKEMGTKTETFFPIASKVISFDELWQCEYSASEVCSWKGPFHEVASHFATSHYIFQDADPEAKWTGPGSARYQKNYEQALAGIQEEESEADVGTQDFPEAALEFSTPGSSSPNGPSSATSLRAAEIINPGEAELIHSMPVELYGNSVNPAEIMDYFTKQSAFDDLIHETERLFERYHGQKMDLIRQRTSLALRRHPGENQKFFAHFSVDWILAEFLINNYDAGVGQKLDRILAATGGSETARMCTVGEYMAWCWPSYSTQLLHIIETALCSGNSEQKWYHTCVPGATGVRESDGAWKANSSPLDAPVSQYIAVDSTLRRFEVEGTEDFVISTAQQLSWLAAVCQEKSKTLTHAYVGFSQVASLPTIGFEIDVKLETPSTLESGSCWNKVVGPAVVVNGFPLPERQPEDRGLEVSISVMASLAGTADFEYEAIQYSKANIQSRRPQLDKVTAGFTQWAQITGEFSLGKKDGFRRSNELDDYEMLLDNAKSTHVLLHDTTHRRAYQTNVEELIHHIIHHRKKLDPSRKKNDLEFADVDRRARATRQVMHNNAEKVLFTRPQISGSALKERRFKEEVKLLYSTLDGLWAQVYECESKSLKLGLPFKQTTSTSGWEYMDVVGNCRRMSPKTIELRKTCGRWNDYAKDIQALVLFGANFGDILKPASARTICSNFSSLPKNECYLAVRVDVLKDLFNQQGSLEDQEKLTPSGYTLDGSKHLYRDCNDVRHRKGDPCTNRRVLRIVKRSTLGHVPIPLELEGAVIVGGISTGLLQNILRKGQADKQTSRQPQHQQIQPSTRAPQGSPLAASPLDRNDHNQPSQKVFSIESMKPVANPEDLPNVKSFPTTSNREYVTGSSTASSGQWSGFSVNHTSGATSMSSSFLDPAPLTIIRDVAVPSPCSDHSQRIPTDLKGKRPVRAMQPIFQDDFPKLEKLREWETPANTGRYYYLTGPNLIPGAKPPWHPGTFKLTCLLIDGHPELDPSSLARTNSDARAPASLQLLDIARCPQELTPKLFNSAYFRELVYLDMSYIPGSVKSAVLLSLNSRFLPELRVLKVQGREMDGTTARLLFRAFSHQLWSLNLSENKLTDGIIDDDFLTGCFSSPPSRSNAHFEKEGKLVLPRDVGSRTYGPLQFIEESEFSSAFTHPERYLADAPFYSMRADEMESQELPNVRADGLGPLQKDTAGAIKCELLDEALSAVTAAPLLLHSRLHFSGIGRLLRSSTDSLEHFECDFCLHTHPLSQHSGNAVWPRVVGLIGSAYLFRPAISSNLRSLRVHHSLVTQVPTLIAEGLPVAAARRLAESVFYRNIRRAYPQAFTPDMNPRLSSLTLTNIPSRSIGPVVEQLLLFLKLMSAQQKAIKDARAIFSGHRQPLLSGLRYLRLEMEPEFSDNLSDPSSRGEVDFDALLDPGNESFNDETLSFFEEESGGVTSRKRSGLPMYGGPKSQFNKPELYADFASGHRLKTWPYSGYDAEYISLHEPNLITSSPVEVWIGTGRIGPHAAVNEYMWNLQDPNLRINIGPATPDHVAAGIPPFSYIFYGAWDAIVFPKDLQSALKASMSLPFRDVATAIKEYRLGTKGTCEHWEGKIELVRTRSF
ncbi:hypothetical protein DL770_008488 [Monosporascus sp. CRB-9-2]|nr:hypothetical protein DL770_008488 [Monosporascus sp. CRB-9-2]